MSGRTNKVCTTLSILAKSFLLPPSQKQSPKQNPNLPARPAGMVSPDLHLLLEAHLCFTKKKMGPYEVGTLQVLFLVFTYFLQGGKQMDYYWCCSCLWQRATREDVPKDTQIRAPHCAVHCKGNLNQSGAAPEADGLNQHHLFRKSPMHKNPQETNRFAD